MWIDFATSGDSHPKWHPLRKGDKEPKMVILDQDQVRMAEDETRFRERMTFTQGIIDRLREGRRTLKGKNEASDKKDEL